MNRTLMEITTLDRPGLLAKIGKIFVKFQIQLHHAKITTMGERVEDCFFITNKKGLKIDDKEELELLRRSVLRILN